MLLGQVTGPSCPADGTLGQSLLSEGFALVDTFTLLHVARALEERRVVLVPSEAVSKSPKLQNRRAARVDVAPC